MVALGQTVTIVNNSGKVVKTSKHLVNVFKEAKSAYRERQAEIKAVRNAELDEKRAQHALKNTTIEDDRASRASSHRSRRSGTSERSKRSRQERPPMERGYSDSFYANDDRHPTRTQRPSNLRLEQGEDDSLQRNELARRHTAGPERLALVERPKTSRSASMSDIDMDLAYGELPPPLPLRRRDDEMELRNQVSKLQQLLDEAHCVQYSVTAMIENLQKNPDALAAVALTLGEISNLASKMSPGVLMALKGSFPAVIALLASPQFMIAAGVGVGVTIIALGGYKIIKKIKAQRNEKAIEGGSGQVAEEEENPSEYDELQEIGGDLSRIEMWRRGIADAEADSLGTTSVEGEFITPAAGKFLISEGVIREEDLKSTRSGKSRKSSKSKIKVPKSEPGRSEKSEKSSRDKKERTKKKEPSGLRMLFKSHH